MSQMSGNVDFPLGYRTPPAWAGSVIGRLPELLVEQAHLEKKAGAAAATFLFRLPQDLGVQRALSALAREEFAHFERTLKLLLQRGIPLGDQQPCPYAQQLKAVVRAQMPGRLLDELLVCAVIEERSSERMTLLADALSDRDAELAAFYRDLVAAEQRHGPTYVAAALASFSRAEVIARWSAVTAHEERVLRALPWLPRLHGGAEALPGAVVAES